MGYDPSTLSSQDQATLLDAVYEDVVRHVFDVTREGFGLYARPRPSNGASVVAAARWWVGWLDSDELCGAEGAARKSRGAVAGSRRAGIWGVAKSTYFRTVAQAPSLGSVVVLNVGIATLRKHRNGAASRSLLPAFSRFMLLQALRHPLSTVWYHSHTLSPQGASFIHRWLNGMQWPRPGERTPPDMAARMLAMDRVLHGGAGHESAQLDEQTGAVVAVAATSTRDANFVRPSESPTRSTDTPAASSSEAMKELYVRLNPQWQNGLALVMAAQLSIANVAALAFRNNAPSWAGGAQTRRTPPVKPSGAQPAAGASTR